MSAKVPQEVAQTISLLRSEGRAKLRLADELERTYSGDDPKQINMGEFDRGGFLPRSDIMGEPSVERITAVIRSKSARRSDLAKIFDTSEGKIQELIDSSNGKLHIPDWRGWVKIKGK